MPGEGKPEYKDTVVFKYFSLNSSLDMSDYLNPC